MSARGFVRRGSNAEKLNLLIDIVAVSLGVGKLLHAMLFRENKSLPNNKAKEKTLKNSKYFLPGVNATSTKLEESNQSNETKLLPKEQKMVAIDQDPAMNQLFVEIDKLVERIKDLEEKINSLEKENQRLKLAKEDLKNTLTMSKELEQLKQKKSQLDQELQKLRAENSQLKKDLSLQTQVFNHQLADQKEKHQREIGKQEEKHQQEISTQKTVIQQLRNKVGNNSANYKTTVVLPKVSAPILTPLNVVQVSSATPANTVNVACSSDKTGTLNKKQTEIFYNLSS